MTKVDDCAMDPLMKSHQHWMDLPMLAADGRTSKPFLVTSIPTPKPTDFHCSNHNDASHGMEDKDPLQCRVLAAESEGVDAQEKHAIEKDELIQRATTRLRRRLLEEGVGDVMQEITRLQNELEFLRMDMTVTMDKITEMEHQSTKMDITKQNRQLDVLERRFQAHKHQLDRLTGSTPMEKNSAHETMQSQESSLLSLSAISMSRLSSLSLVSSLFSRSGHSSTGTSVSSFNDDQDPSSADDVSVRSSCCNIDATNDPEEQQRRSRRRTRVKHHRQRYQRRLQSQDTAFIEELAWQNVHEKCNQYENIRQFQPESLLYRPSECNAHFYGNYQTKFGENDLDEDTYSLPSGMMSPLPTRIPQNFMDPGRQNAYNSDSYGRYSHDSAASSEASFHVSLASVASTLSLPQRLTDNLLYDRRLLHRHPLSPFSPPLMPSDDYFHHDVPLPTGQRNFLYTEDHKTQTTDEPASPNDVPACTMIVPERNVLDDALSYLNGLDENDSDDGLREDLYMLLRHPDLSQQPWPEAQMYLQQQEPSIGTRSGLPHWLWNLASSAVHTGWRWCRFLSVLILAVIISVVQGPEDVGMSL
ncbi:uncharacterized protein BYT42DRAFT_561230 [Radiomyces spectabilis]|uniref:uncharacterized protein n=1 Tax=Radiomyces spectabilis TaxID=64574 RepID=UPI00221FC649|nr:uncharacterized protein BYT42DRAFT_561230 [Radiomyces spectabilis]KAI8388788.1 hypothetical protein BYT42DRAFT_561230 [Radiomyces spectabilis]